MSRHDCAWASGLSFLLTSWTLGLKMLALFYFLGIEMAGRRRNEIK